MTKKPKLPVDFGRNVNGPPLENMSEPLRIFLEYLGDYNFGDSLRGVALTAPGKMQAQYGWDANRETPKYIVEFEIKSNTGYVEVPYGKQEYYKSPLTDAYNMAVEDCYRIVEAQVAEYDTGDDGFGAGAAILDLWKGIKPKREPFLVSDKEEVIRIPGGVYYNPIVEDFFDENHVSKGAEFSAKWLEHAPMFEHAPIPREGDLGIPPSDDPALNENEGIDIVARPRTPEEQAERNAQFMGGRGDEVWD